MNNIGWYFRMALPGTYSITVDAPGYATVERDVVVDGYSKATLVNFELQKLQH